MVSVLTKWVCDTVSLQSDYVLMKKCRDRLSRGISHFVTRIQARAKMFDRCYELFATRSVPSHAAMTFPQLVRVQRAAARADRRADGRAFPSTGDRADAGARGRRSSHR